MPENRRMLKNKMNNNLLHKISGKTSLEAKILALTGVFGFLYIIYQLIIKGETSTSIVLAAIPLATALILLIVQSYKRIFYLLFVSHFIFLIFSREYDIPLGILTFTFNIIVVGLLLLITVYKKTTWKDSWNGMLLLYMIWGVYCVAELGNANTVQAAWNIAITHYVVYPVICAILVPLTIRKTKNIQWLFFLWSLFIIIAAVKTIYQKQIGFTDKELYFLYELGGAETHLIWSGIRYFSFFTDAANLGVHMAMAMLAFGILAYITPKKRMKIYYVAVVVLATYSMLLSGTRTAIAVPIGGLIAFTLLSKNWKTAIVGVGALAAIFLFFRFTTIGESNEYIRKMRSAFNPSEDASYQVRVQNRELMKTYMVHKPFGYGLGLGGKAERFRPHELMPIPPDSWLINVWTDTGIVGFIIYMIIHIILFAWCSWIIMFKLTCKRLRNLLIVWLSVDVGFFIAAYGNDVMQYPNMIILYTGFALCFAGPSIERREKKAELNNV